MNYIGLVLPLRRFLDLHAEVLRQGGPCGILDADFERHFPEIVGHALNKIRVGWIGIAVEIEVGELHEDVPDGPAALGVDLHHDVAKPRHDEATRADPGTSSSAPLVSSNGTIA